MRVVIILVSLFIFVFIMIHRGKFKKGNVMDDDEKELRYMEKKAKEAGENILKEKEKKGDVVLEAEENRDVAR